MGNHALSFAAACLVPALSAALFAQQATIIKAETPLTLALADNVYPGKLAVGDTVQFTLPYPLRVDGKLIAKTDTPATGRVVAINPELVVSVQALSLGGGAATLPVKGNPFLLTKGKLAEVKPPEPPAELESHGHLDAGDVAAMAAVGAIAAPIVVLASPFLLYGALHHDKKHPEELHYNKGRLVQVEVANDTPVPAEVIAPLQNTYTGKPLIYVVDRYSEKRSDIACGRDNLIGKPDTRTNLFRVDAGSYPFHTAHKGDAVATVEAQDDHRYLIYRDSSGLHPVNLDDRPDLLDLLPAPDGAKTSFFFDVTKAEPEQMRTLADDRARGGCGIVKLLRKRTAPPTAAPVN